MVPFTEADLLRLWESGTGASRARRAVALAAAATGEPARPEALTVGRMNSDILALRRRCFGGVLPCAVDCPVCGAELEVSLDVEDLVSLIADPSTRRPLRIGDWLGEVRAVLVADLLAAEGRPDPVAELARRCVTVAEGNTVRAGAVGSGPVDLVSAVSDVLAELDPMGDVGVDLDCVDCGHEWRAGLDVIEMAWAEIERYAKGLLLDVHALATAYGWTEADVLAVPPARRRFYLQVVA